MNIYGVLGVIAVVVLGGGVIAYQHNEVTGLKTERDLQKEKIVDLEAKVALGTKERIRLDGELQNYQNRKAEIEVRYIKTPVTVYKEIVKTVPAEIVLEQANKETNALFDSINTAAIDFSLRH